MEFVALYAQEIFFAILIIMFALFIWGKLRFDIVALGALTTLAFLGVVPASDIFSGFADPVIILVVSIFIISAGLARSGLVDALTRPLTRLTRFPILTLVALMAITAIISGFISNIAAVTIMLPIATRLARKAGRPLGLFLMPLAFSALLGALGTSVGTTPNIIISGFRAEELGATFGFFDFAPVGYILAAIGLVFLAAIGWRLIPKRQDKTLASELFEVEDYVTEVEIPRGSKFIGKTILAIYKAARHEHLTVMSILRPRRAPEGEDQQYDTLKAPPLYQEIQEGDILLLRADSETIDALLDTEDVVIRGSKAISEEDLGGEDVSTIEVVVEPDSPLVGKSLKTLGVRHHFGINILAIAREDEHIFKRLSNVVFKAGDVLLLQGKTDTLNEMIAANDLLPLRARDIRVGTQRHIFFAAAVFIAVILLATTSSIPLHLIFLLAAGIFVLTGILKTEDLYENIDWSIVILLGAMLALGNVFQSVGGAETLADFFLRFSDIITPNVALGIFLVLTLGLTNVIDNTAVAVMMAPIALIVAQGLGIAADPLLMAVAVGASVAILTPVAQTPNALVMGPAGYKFGDYFKVGGILSIIILIAAFFLIKTIWPF